MACSAAKLVKIIPAILSCLRVRHCRGAPAAVLHQHQHVQETSGHVQQGFCAVSMQYTANCRGRLGHWPKPHCMLKILAIPTLPVLAALWTPSLLLACRVINVTCTHRHSSCSDRDKPALLQHLHSRCYYTTGHAKRRNIALLNCFQVTHLA